MAFSTQSMDGYNTNNSFAVSKMRSKTSANANLIETLNWYYPGTTRNAAECVLKTHNIDGSFLIIKERIGGYYEFYDLCVWNVGTPSHFQIKYCKELNLVEFGLKKYNFAQFQAQFEKPSRIVRSDKDVILLKYPLPSNVREPSGLWDNIITQDLDVNVDRIPNISLVRMQSDPNVLSDLGMKGGYLIKRGHLIKNWKRRWFQLEKQNLSYFEAKPHLIHNPNPKPKGVLDLTETLQFITEDHTVKQPFCFAIVLTRKTFSICADNAVDYHSWIEALKTAIDKYQDIAKRNLPTDFV